MKKYILLPVVFALSSNQIYSQPHTNEDIERTFDTLIAAYNGAQTEIAEQNHQPEKTLSDEQVEKLKQEAADAINTLQRISTQLEQGNTKAVADILDNIQTQFDQSDININARIFENSASYLRRWDEIKQDWQEKHPDESLQDLSATEVDDFLRLIQTNLNQGTEKEHQISEAIGGMFIMLNTFEKISNTPIAEEQKLSQEIAQLKALAEFQGIQAGRQINTNALLNTLKIRVAEHQIGLNSPADIQILQTKWAALIEHPRPLFNEKEFDIAERLLRAMGNEFSVIHHEFQQRKKYFIIH